jgi:flagellin
MSSPLAINTNSASINAQRNLSITGRNLNNSIEKLSSGVKINSSADDAANVAVSEGMRAQLGGFSQASENANDAVAIIATAEGSYNAISDIMVRMRELAVQGANDGLTNTERAYLDTEFTQLISEIDRISDVAEYNGIKLLDGTAGDGSGTMTFQVGTRNTANDQITIVMNDQDSAALAVDSLQVDSLGNSQDALAAIDTAIATLATDRATLGSTINQLTAAVDNLGTTIENLSSANSQIQDTDVSSESAKFTQNQVLMQAGVSMLSQSNGLPNLALRLLG